MYLNCHTYYSLRYGAFSEKVLLQLAKEKGISSLALTDVNNTSACLNFIRLAPKYGVKPIVGIDFRNDVVQEFIGLAKNNSGFQELNVFLSSLLESKKEVPSYAPSFKNAYVIYPLRKFKKEEIRLRENEFVGVGLHEIGMYRFFQNRIPKEKCVLLQPVTFRVNRDFNVHRLLRAIEKNTILSKLSPEDYTREDELFYEPSYLQMQLEEFPHLEANANVLLKRCVVSFDFSENRVPQNKQNFTESDEKDKKLMDVLVQKGLLYRYGTSPSKVVLDRIKKELKVIKEMGFLSYFLINWDIVRYARSKGYFYVGRGSGANSIIAYLLRITDVDPVELDLYFERFINLYRVNPPDFDIDFSWRDREDVTRYIFEKNEHVALLATYNCFQYKGSVRELGKVFGLPKEEIDKLTSGKFDAMSIDKLSLLVLKYSRWIEGMPNHLSVHSSGILVAQKPIHSFSATNLPPKGFPTVQFDMVIAEDVGLFKFDILGQRGLAKIKETISIIQENRPEDMNFDIHNVKQFKEDAVVNKLVSDAKCIGCFYVESPAMRMLLKKLEVNDYLGLVAASSIIRPGVAKSGMMKEYILRKKDPNRVREKANPILLDLMPDTYGVMVYQEDVIKVAHHFAGLSLGEADVLRRGMSGKYRSREEFQAVKEKFFENCQEKGYDAKMTAEVWRQTESFAGYAFAKGHSASYAVESYQSLFLKTYFPLEYMVAVLNNGGGFYRAELYVHEARMAGANVYAPCVNKSSSRTVIQGKEIYLGFNYVQDLKQDVVVAILQSRVQNGLFKGLNDFLERVPMSIEQADKLIRIGAFNFTKRNKRELLWEAHRFIHKEPKLSVWQKPLFSPNKKTFALPSLACSELEHAFDQIELLGFPLVDPFMLLEEPVKPTLSANDLVRLSGRLVEIVGYYVTTKNAKTSRGDRMYFGTFLDRQGYFIDTVHFPNAAKSYPFRGKGVYRIRGHVAEEFGFFAIEVSEMERLNYLPDPRYS